MPVGSFLALLDDIALQSKVAISKASGIVTDDLALNSNMVTGIPREREWPVVAAIARWSLVSKFALGTAALGISATCPWLIAPLLMVGGSYLCYEGVEKVKHAVSSGGHDVHAAAATDKDALPRTPENYQAHEKSIIRNAITTDVVLSAEIIAMTLGTLNPAASVLSHAATLGLTGLVMTAGVYGLVAGIVKIDDAAIHLQSIEGDGRNDRLIRKAGGLMLKAVPYVMKTLSVVGTAAMFIVGGGIIAHNIPFLHHAVEAMTPDGLGGTLLSLGADTVAGIATGLVTMVGVGQAGKVYDRLKKFSGAGGRAAPETIKTAGPAAPSPEPKPGLKHSSGLDQAVRPAPALAQAAVGTIKPSVATLPPPAIRLDI